MDTPSRTLAAERSARVYDPMVTPSVSRGSYGHYLRRNANRSATQRAHKRASLSATDSTTSDMADHALKHQPIELQGIVGHKTLHTLATYRRLRIFHTLPNNIGISSSSVIVIIQGDVSVQFLIIMCFIYPDIYLFRHLRNFLARHLLASQSQREESLLRPACCYM